MDEPPNNKNSKAETTEIFLAVAGPTLFLKESNNSLLLSVEKLKSISVGINNLVKAVLKPRKPKPTMRKATRPKNLAAVGVHQTLKAMKKPSKIIARQKNEFLKAADFVTIGLSA